MTHSACNVCHAELAEPIFRSAGRSSLTSLCEVRPEETVVRFCNHCGHTQTDELTNAAEFYDQDYRILVDSDDEDQLYEVREGERIFRLEHQTNVALQKVQLPTDARVLDFGAAKAASLRKLMDRRSDLKPHVFDVSQMYQSFWDRFIPKDQQACYTLPADWTESFDLVTSWFVLEHVSNLNAALSDVLRALKSGGTYLLTVPNVFANTADFVVVDHVNHFSAASIRTLLQQAGFVNVQIDTEAYNAAFVVTAVKPESAERGVPHSPSSQQINETKAAISSTAEFWQSITDRIRRQEAEIPAEEPIAIYGAGFYGSYILTQLQNPQRVRCLVDANEYLWNTERFGTPVVGPNQLASDVQHVFAGLNPAAARRIMGSIEDWKSRRLNYLFLEDHTQQRSAA